MIDFVVFQFADLAFGFAACNEVVRPRGVDAHETGPWFDRARYARIE
jgi:hypothetical protein